MSLSKVLLADLDAASTTTPSLKLNYSYSSQDVMGDASPTCDPWKAEALVWEPILATVDENTRTIKDAEAQSIIDFYSIKASELSLAEVRLRLVQIKFDKWRRINENHSYLTGKFPYQQEKYTIDDATQYFFSNFSKSWSKGNYNDLLDQLAFMESGHVSSANNGPYYYGLFAMSKSALHEAGVYNQNTDIWIKSDWNPTNIQSMSGFVASSFEAQSLIKKSCDYKIYYYLYNSNTSDGTNALAKVGTTIENTVISLSGGLQACHLLGGPSVARALRNGNLSSLGTDGNGVEAKYYMELFYGFNVQEIATGYFANEKEVRSR